MRSLSACASARVRPISTSRSARLSIRSSRRARSARLEVLEAVEAQQCAARARRPSVASASASGRSRSRTSISTSGAPAAVATIAAASGPHTTSGRCVSACSEQATSATASSRPVDAAAAAHAPQRDRRAGLGSPVRAPSMNAASRSASLTGRSASGIAGSGDEQADRAQAQQPARPGRSTRARPGVDAVAREQARRPAAAAKPPGDVVLQVGVQPPVARVQLGRRAHRQRRGVERVEAEVLDGLQRAPGRTPASRGRRRASAPGRRRCTGRGARRPGCPRRRRRLHGRPQTVIEELKPAGRPAQPATSRATASASRSIASPGWDTVSGPPPARPAAAPHGPPRGRSARCPPGCPGCTGRTRRRCRCRP